MTQKYRPHILMYCGNGYSFDEYFKPVIEVLNGDCSIHLLQGDYYLASATQDAVKQCSLQGENFSYQLVHIFRKGESAFQYHRDLYRLLKKLAEHDIDMLVITTDFYPIDHYLIHFARLKGALVVILHNNVMSPIVLDRYRKSVGLNFEAIPIQSRFEGNRRRLNKLLNQQGWIERVKLIEKYATARLDIVQRKISKKWYRFKNYYVFPYMFSRVSFPWSPYDEFGFTSGFADAVICYDSMDVAALQYAVPAVKNVHLACHPASAYRHPPDERDPVKKLLVLLSCYGSELPQNHLDFWERTIKRITELINVDEIHLRFHPRTDESLHWPSKMSQMVAQFGCVRIVDTNNVSLTETAADYIGVVGAVSGALRPARAVCSGFVLGLVNAPGDSWEEDWMLGKAEGIHWIHEGEEVEEAHLADFRFQVDRPTVAEIIRQLLPSF